MEPKSMEEKNRELRERREKARLGGGREAVEKQHAKGKLTARERIEKLLDPGSFVELDPFVVHRCTHFGMEKRRALGDAVVTGHGTIGGRLVFVYAQDATFMGGSLGEMHAEKICKVMDLALKVGAPIIGLNDSGGARIQEGVASLAGYGRIFQRNVAASGVVPQISAVLGPAAGGAVYSPALTDFVFMVRGISYMFITGPRVIRQVTGEEVTFGDLGGPWVHGTLSGVASFVAETEEECFHMIRRLLSYLPSNNMEDPPVVKTGDPPGRVDETLGELIPSDPRKAYDVREVVRRVVDIGTFLEVQGDFAPNAVVGFARLNGHTVGVVASQPRAYAGCMDIDSSDKVARFVRFCDAFNVPIITFQDVPGYLPGVEQEHGGIIRHGAKVIYAYAEATVPKVTIILRKAYGGAYIAMGSKHLGADLVFALPTAEIAVMGPEGAVEIIFRRDLKERPELRGKLVAEYREEFASPYQAASLGYVDDVIEPREIRPRLVAALEMLLGKRARPHPPRKHGNMPV